MDKMNLFLSDEEMATLTGRKTKSAQIRALRMMGVPHQINAAGRAVVVTANLIGQGGSVVQKASWQSNKVKS